jgi:4a-hydroxytetrahydrobiopterin dehydratase
MNNLLHGVCIPCETGGDPMNEEQIGKYKPQVPDWQVIDTNSIAKLSREFKFKDFVQSIAFADEVGKLAEKNGHHPRLIVEWEGHGCMVDSCRKRITS